MRKLKLLSSVVLCSLCIQWAIAQQTPVQKYGQLSINGKDLVDKNGAKVQLRGMSLFWSQWPEGSKYYNASVVKWLRDDWCANVVRAAMAVDQGGYASNEGEKNKIFTVIDAAIANGIYVIVDFHVHEAQNYKSQAITFFKEVATKYGQQPNIIYEIWNEPLEHSWANTIKPYSQDVINEIRKIDNDNIIICGTRTYSQRVDEAAANPVTGTNIAYTFHYYANTHLLNSYNSEGQITYRNSIITAQSKGYAVFVTEYGTCNADGNGPINTASADLWWQFLDGESRNISYVNWAISDKGETSAALNGGASSNGGWPTSALTPSGILVREHLKERCAVITSLKEGESAVENSLMCFPNPFTGDFTIQAEGVFDYTVYDMTGNPVEKGNAISSVVAGDQLHTGMYLVKITNAKGTKFAKVAKN